MMKRIAVAALMMFVVGCKASVEGEEKAWTANQAKVKELSVLFPKFAPALTEQQTKTEAALTAARAMSDKEASAKAMRDANEMLSTGWVVTLAGLEKKKNTMDGKWTQAHTDAKSVNAEDSIKELEVQVYNAQTDYKSLVDNGAADAMTAEVMVKKVDGELSSASSAADKVSAEFKKKAAAAKAAAVTTDAGAVVAPVAADAGVKK
jgi:hypothetical protein